MKTSSSFTISLLELRPSLIKNGLILFQNFLYLSNLLCPVFESNPFSVAKKIYAPIFICTCFIVFFYFIILTCVLWYLSLKNSRWILMSYLIGTCLWSFFLKKKAYSESEYSAINSFLKLFSGSSLISEKFCFGISL